MKKLLPLLFISLLTLLSCEEENIVVNDTIRNFIEQKYQGARILTAEKEFNGDIDVDIIHDNIQKDVKFNSSNKWISTTWDIPISQLPDAAKESILNKYPDYRIEDVDYIEQPDGDHYKVEMEKGEWEKTVFVKANGEILN